MTTRKLILIILRLFTTLTLSAIEPYSSDDHARAAKIVSEMSLKQKLDFLGGRGMGTRGYPAIGIEPVEFADSTTGVRGSNITTAFPAAIAMAATWDKALIAEVAEAIGLECRATGIGVLLGPGMNLYRIPQNGRNFEYFGEDPYLVAALTTEYIKALQSTGVIATAKHFVANNQDYDRHRRNSIVSERALHELYFPAFKSAIDKGGVKAIMTAYNGVNGDHASESSYLLQDILRERWGYEGIIMSDWSSTYSTLPLYKAGLDLEMPRGKWLNSMSLSPFFKSGELDEAELDERITRMIAALLSVNAFSPEPTNFNSEDHNEIAKEVAREGIVLLKNEGGLLPLDSSQMKRIAVVGPNAVNTPVGGGGAAYLRGSRDENFFDSFAAMSAEAGVEVDYYQTCEIETKEYHKRHRRKWRAGNHPGTDQIPAVERVYQLNKGETLKNRKRRGLSSAFIQARDTNIATAAEYDAVIVCVGFDSKSECESRDRTFALFDEQISLIQELSRLNENVIVILNAGGGVEMQSWIEKVPAVIHSWYLGQNSGEPLSEVLWGKTNPSGKLPISIEKKWEDNCAYGSYSLENPDPKGVKYPYNSYAWKEFELQPEPYPEGIFVGYRHLERNNIEPLFAFGHGLSYTTFSYEKMTLSSASIAKGESLEATVTVTNSGSIAGDEIVQLYIADPESSLPRPPKELKGFTKVFLEPGETREVVLTIMPEDMQFYDESSSQWVAEPGLFEVKVGSSSDLIALTSTFELK